MEKRTFFLIIIFVILGLFIGGSVGYFLGVEKGKSQIERPVKIPEEIFMRAGEVVEIEGNIIHIKAKVLGGKADPKTGEVETEILKVSVDQYTEITFPEDPQSGHPIEAKFEDIKVDSLLYVSSSENIKDKKEFRAKEIIILNKL